MNFTALLPNGMTKDCWIASLKPDDHFCTRRPMKCANCLKNSLEHKCNCPSWHRHKLGSGCNTDLDENGTCGCMKFCDNWQPLPPALKVGCKKCGLQYDQHAILNKEEEDYIGIHGRGSYEGHKYAICSGRGKPAICTCGARCYKKGAMKAPGCKPLSCELIAIDDDLEWTKQAFKGKSQMERYEIMCAEAAREGFQDWQQWEDWMTAYYGGIPKCWRYQFKR